MLDPASPQTGLRASEDQAIPVPTGRLATEVLGPAASVHEFLYGGFIVAEGLRDALALIGRPIASFRRILDFGCGSARVLRWFESESETSDLIGYDISRAAIEWDRRHMPFGEFRVSGLEPPLPRPDASVDLVFAISVVTHLDEALQIAWLQELRRILRPGGIAMVTAQADEVAAWFLSEGERESFLAKGHLYHRVADHGLHGLPDFYQDTYHSRAYIERVWSRLFRLRAHIAFGPMYLQDLVVMEREGEEDEGRLRPEPVWLDLPVTAIWTPRIGSRVTGDELPVHGWAFHPRGGQEEVDIWIGGRRRASLAANQPTPTVADAFPTWPAAAHAGFSGVVDISDLEPGPHVWKLARRTDLVASHSGYFLKTD